MTNLSSKQQSETKLDRPDRDQDQLSLLTEALHASRQKYNRLAESVDRGICIVREDRFIEHNQIFARMCGMTADEISSSRWSEILYCSEQPAAADIPAQTLSDREQKNDEPFLKGTLTTKLKEVLKVGIKRIRLQSRTRATDLIIVRDISAFNKMEAELQKAKKLESIAALSGGIAHDYNNLLTVIIGNISLARALLQEDQRTLSLLNEAQKASRIAKELTKRLITFSKGGVPTKTLNEVSPLVRSATEFSLSGSNVKYEFAIDDDLWPVALDKSQIGQAIHNIIINADEAMPEGGAIHVSASNIEIPEDSASLKKGPYVNISITDTGIGISEEHIASIFDPYFSTKEMGTQKGMGLGLSIAHSIVQKHDGDIQVESVEGRGTTFTIFLPASTDCQEMSPAETCRETRPARTFPLKGKGRILVMDDEEMIRDVALKLLSYLGYQAEFAAHGEEAITMYKSALDQDKPFDVVILDLTIRGGMGGKETIKKLLEIDPDVKGIVSSGYANTPVVQNYREFGFCGNISKPYNLNEMGFNLNKILA